MALKVGELFASFNIDSTGVTTAISNIQRQCESLGTTMQLTGTKMTAMFTAPLVKTGKKIVETGMSFEKQMSDVFAKSGLDKNVESDVEAMDALTAKALYMGSTTVWTATEAGEALSYMAMAGWETEQMLAGLESVMNLASASGADLGRASDIVTDAMTAMGYTMTAAGGDAEVFQGYVEHFTDVLAAAATNSNTNIEMMGESFKYAAPLAGSLGYTVDEMALALGLMANNGIKSSMAGTSLRNILKNMITPTDAAADAMAYLGTSLYDAKGNVKSLSDLMYEWRDAAKRANIDTKSMYESVKLLDASFAAGEIDESHYDALLAEITAGADDFLQAVSALAGTRGLSGFLAIVNATDEDFESLEQSIADSEGATQKMADTMLDNTAGAVTLLQSAIEGLSTTIFSLYSDTLQGFIEKLTSLVQNLQQANPELLTMGVTLATVAAAAGPVTLLMGTLVKRLPNLIPLVESLVSPLGVVTSALALFGIAAFDTENKVGEAFEGLSEKAADKLSDVNEVLPEKLDGVSDRMAILAESIKNGVEALVPELTDTIGTVIVGFLDAVSANAGGILDIGLAVIDGIVEGLTKNLPDMLPALVNAMTSVFSALVEAVPSLLSSGIDLVGAIIDGLANIDWAANASSLAASLTTAFEKVLGLLVNVDFASMAGTLGNIAANLVTALLNSIKQLLSDIASGDTDFAGMIEQLIVNIFSAVSELIPQVFDIAGAIVKWLLDPSVYTQIFGAATAIGKAIFNGIITGIGDLYDTLVGYIDSLLEKIGVSEGTRDFFKDTANGMKEGAVGMADEFINNLTNLFDTSTVEVKPNLVWDDYSLEDQYKIIASNWDNLTKANLDRNSFQYLVMPDDSLLGVSNSKIKEVMSQLEEIYGENLSSTTSEIVAATEEASAEIDVAYASYLATLDELGIDPNSDFVKGNVEGVTNASTALKAAVDTYGSEAIQGIIETMSYAEGYSIGFDFTQAMVDAVSAQAGGMTGAGQSIGASFGDGIVAGINSKQAAVAAAAAALGSAMIAATSSSIEVGSPSRKARDEIGAMYDMGIVEGLYGEMHSIEKAARAVGNSMHDEFLLSDPYSRVRAGAARQTADAFVNAAQNSGIVSNNGDRANMVSAVANAMANRPIYLVQDGKIVARINAGYNAAASNERNQQIALGYGK